MDIAFYGFCSYFINLISLQLDLQGRHVIHLGNLLIPEFLGNVSLELHRGREEVRVELVHGLGEQGDLLGLFEAVEFVGFGQLEQAV